ncbi:phage portal protein [Methylocystis sp.]|uniref:phage portal protein n=1 Tax=Methylocystis sp. TaxID=1911079 RepID=UPI003D0E3FEB
MLAGVSATPQRALSRRENAVSLISGAVGSLPLPLPLALYREEGQGKVEATDHPAFEVIADAANDWTSSSDLRKQLAIDAMLHGDGFGLANRLPSGEVFELIRAVDARAKQRLRNLRRPHRPRLHRSGARNVRRRAGRLNAAESS